MTSRISFSKMLREEWKHHLVSIFLVVLCFLGEVLFFYFDIQSLIARRSNELLYIKEALAAEGEPVIEAMIPAMFLGVLLAGEYYSYLHSRKKTDFYLSLPVRRGKQFLMGVAVCGSIFVLPCLLATGLEIGIGVATGYATKAFFVNMLWRAFCKLLCFAGMWITMALAMVVTGNLVVALLGFGAFCSYIPIFIRYLLPTYQEFFYETYVSLPGADIWYYFSPVSLATGLSGRYFNWTLAEHMDYMIGMIVFIVLVGALTFFLYVKRPAEAAGKAMAFEKANTVIRFAIVIPLTLYFGFFLSQLSRSEAEIIWLFFGVVVGAILLHGIVESIFNFDLRKMFSKKKQLIITMVVCLGFVIALQSNIYRFNSFVPDEDEVERVVLSLSNDMVAFYPGYREERADVGVAGDHVDSVLQLVENAMELNVNLDSYNENEALSMLEVHYMMKDGKEIARRYNSLDVLNEENRMLLDSIMATEEFKKDYYSLYEADLTMLKELSYNNGYDSVKFILTEDEKEQLVDIYLKELSALSYTEMETVERVGAIKFIWQDQQVEEYYIHSNFKETLEFLKSVNVDVSSPLEKAELISIEFYEEYYDGKVERGVIVQSPDLLDEVKDQFILETLYGGHYIHSLRDTTIGHLQFSINHRLDGMAVAVRKDVKEVLKKSVQ